MDFLEGESGGERGFVGGFFGCPVFQEYAESRRLVTAEVCRVFFGRGEKALGHTKQLRAWRLDIYTYINMRAIAYGEQAVAGGMG